MIVNCDGLVMSEASRTTIVVTKVGTMDDFRAYLAARAVAVTGTLVSLVAMPVLVYQLTGSPAWTAAVAAVEALPYLLFGLVAGAVADHADRRRLMVGADLAAAAALASVPLAWWAGALTPAHVLAVAVAVQTAFVFFDAANFGALPTLVGRDRLTRAYSTLYGTTTALELVVPALAGLAVVVVAPAPLVGINAVTALAAALLVARIAGPLSAPVPAGERRTLAAIPAGIGQGLRFVAGHRVVRTLTLVGAANAVAGGAWVAVLLPWADRVLGIAPTGDPRLALLFSCFGVGAVAASRLVPPLAGRFGGARVALGALPVSLACALLVLAATHWALALAAALAWGTAHATVVLNAITFRQQVCPDGMQARVNTTARMLSWGIGMPAGAALAGLVAVGPAGPRGGLAVAAGAVAVALVLAWVTPALRAAAYPVAAGSS